ncbi:MAG TPA: YihY/virulence factor BrkB family protein [Alphaproteobacteria bacterium]|nr:YihY/virulence factor BrkB family protein [Alphaproteobacteria bacterium]
MKPPTPLHLIWKAADGLVSRNGIEIAGYIAFTAMLSLFPFMIFLVSVAAFFGDTSAGENFLNTMAMFAPPEVMKTLLPAIDEVTRNRSGGLLTIGLLLALYSAGSAVAALRLALNLSYGLDENRSFWWRKTEDFLIVIVGSILLILLSIAIIMAPLAWKVITWFLFLDPADQSLWHIARYSFAIAVMAGGVIALHRILPDAKLEMRQILPGALTTTILWIAAASALSFYFGSFADYNATYGSLGGVIVTLMFFYVTAIIFIFGGELNAAMMAHVEKHAPGPNPELRSLPAKT